MNHWPRHSFSSSETFRVFANYGYVSAASEDCIVVLESRLNHTGTPKLASPGGTSIYLFISRHKNCLRSISAGRGIKKVNDGKAESNDRQR